ncbi:MAG: hypothetical protein M3R64_00655 [Pseudomonadota bacterium]|nr:hypothetical protein [Pseudomonadota bacterium]
MSVFLLLALVAASPQQATDAQRSAKDAAAAFTLDSVDSSSDDARAVASEGSTTMAPEGSLSEPPRTTSAPATSTGLSSEAAVGPAAVSWLDIPIASLIANPATRAVLDRDLPGLTADENLPKFQTKSLREFQPLTGGQLTDALLSKVEADFRVAPPPPPVRSSRGER